MNDILSLSAPLLSGVFIGAGLMWLALRGHLRGQNQLADTFKALAADTLSQNSENFLQLAESKLKEREQHASNELEKKQTAIDSMIKPVKETLQKMDEQLRDLEVKREGAYRELAKMVGDSRETQQQLRNETGQLLQALRAPTSRGQWGELQLKRILEMTGMSEHAKDFSTQETFHGEDNNIRPDVLIYLPGDRRIIVDSKVPLTAYLDWTQSQDERVQNEALAKHAGHLKNHIKTLSSKAYWEKVEGAPEFVVLFLPGEYLLSAALDADPSLMDYSAERHVVIATPMTLIALLRTANYGWKQEALHENVRQIEEMGRNMYGALTTFTNHMEKLGKGLSGAINAFNSAVGSLERNVMSKARRMAEISGETEADKLEAPSPIDREPRLVVIKGGEEEEKPALTAQNKGK